MSALKFHILTPLAFVAFLFSGCASHFSPLKTAPATLGTKTTIYPDLVKLPEPSEKIVTAVYKFRDQTGQYKSSATGTSWSTAVTQGATSILTRALEESGWFVVIEREGLSNLLNERKIIRSSRANFSGQNGDKLPPLPPLLYAGIILEGGVISYDSNVITGGSGARYFGLGASGQYRQDRVTIYLRAISTQNGRVLKTVYTTKTVLSQMIDIGFYRFVKFKRLLEAETGFSYNEPPEICVTEAIEKAVHSLIIEGILDGLWQLNDQTAISSPVIERYMEERDAVEQTDYFGELARNRRGNYGAGLNMAAQLYAGDYPNPMVEPAGELSFSKALSPEISVSLNAGRGIVSDEKYFETTINEIKLQGIYFLFPKYRFTPYLLLGAGLLNVSAEAKIGDSLQSGQDWLPAVVSGIGAEYLLQDNLGITIIFDNHYTFNDELDGIKHGNRNDYFWGGRMGINFYWGD